MSLRDAEIAWILSCAGVSTDLLHRSADWESWGESFECFHGPGDEVLSQKTPPSEVYFAGLSTSRRFPTDDPKTGSWDGIPFAARLVSREGGFPQDSRISLEPF
ncbi:hypothetical protein CISG_04750 [Coccidioides immitis RMSCC 3703]|nr:hypothetical protein CISG_04750 [Coccidioides immitis RMSCC 3703]